MVKKGDNILVCKKSIFKKNRKTFKGVVTDVVKRKDYDFIGEWTDTFAKVLLENNEEIEIEIDSTTVKGFNSYKILNFVGSE